MAQVPSMNPGREGQLGRRAVARSALAGLFALLLALAACSPTPPREPSDPPLPGGSSLSAPETMHGQTRATVQVSAEQAWQLRVVDAPSGGPTPIASRVSLSRDSGTGPANVTLTIDPSGLDHTLDHRFQLQLRTEGRTYGETVEFTFPFITGYALLDAAAASAELRGAADQPTAKGPTDKGVVVRPNGQANTELSGEGTPAEAPDRGLSTAPEGRDMSGEAGQAGRDPVEGDTVTLLVGLEPATPSLTGQGRAAEVGVPGPGPAPAALSALGTSVARIAGAAVESRFDEASLAFVEVPATEVEAAIAQLELTKGVTYVERPVPIYPFSDDQFRDLQWNLDRVQAEQLWSVSDGSGVTIAVLDNGFYPDHPDLRHNVVGQYDAGDQLSSVQSDRPECGTHGTHVAGIAAAVANNQIGVAGTAPGAGLYLVDLDYSERPGCPMDSTSLVRGIQHVVTGNGGSPHADVMNLSLGASTPLGEATQSALRAARDAGIIVVGAAGNTACNAGQPTYDPVSYPAAYPEVWAVGATDRNDGRACYSHVGPEVFIAAPGGDGFGSGGRYDTIFSTDHDVPGRNHIYGWQEGTSMAAPVVAGVVALLKGAVPAASNEEIRQAIIAGATDLGPRGRDDHVGYGLINAVEAYEALTGAAEPPPPPPEPTLETMWITFPEDPLFPTTQLDPDGLFTITHVPTGPFLIVVGTDENENGIIGEPGELYGEVTVNVQFDQRNQAVVYLEER